MSSIRALLIPVLLVVCAMAYADEREVRQAAEDLLTLTNVERNLDEVRTQIVK
jgi:CHASE3 domain sensor protein